MQQRCAVRAPSRETLYVPMEDKLMGWNVHPRWSSEYRFFRLTSQLLLPIGVDRKREILVARYGRGRSVYPPVALYYPLPCNFLVIYDERILRARKKKRERSVFETRRLQFKSRFERRLVTELPLWMKHLGRRWFAIFLEFERFGPLPICAPNPITVTIGQK